MDKKLQQRLIGAILLVALGVIFIPVLLDGSGFKSRHGHSIDMPAEPRYPPLHEIKLESAKPDPLPAQQSPTPAAAKPVEKPAKKTELNKDLTAFALQVSTVKVKENAYRLRDKLRKAGYTTYVETRKKDGVTSYRVRIGPELEKSKIEEIKQRVKKEQGLDGFIVNHP